MENIPPGQRENNRKTKEESNDAKNISSVCDLFFFPQFSCRRVKLLKIEIKQTIVLIVNNFKKFYFMIYSIVIIFRHHFQKF